MKSLLLGGLALLASSALAQDVYDYVVIGSGPGGGPLAVNLAKAGYSVFLIEAGDDSPSQGFGAYIPTVTWDFFVTHYPPGDPRNNDYSHLTWKTADGKFWVGQSGAPAGAKLLGVYYPRGATLGGSSMINAMAAYWPSDSDWNFHYNVTGDETWKAENLRKTLMKIEHNNYLPNGTAGHGFNGFFQTNMATMRQKAAGGLTGDKVIAAYAEALSLNASLADLLTKDTNALTPNRDQEQSVYGLVQHQYSNGDRYSSRDYIQAAVKAGNNITVSMQSLATKVLFDTAGKCGGKKPRAIGVEYLKGASLYSGDPRRNATTKGEKKTVRARREVIVSGGAFNSPQILLLSGVGAKEHLAEFNITTVVDLPGVGQHLMDNQEMPILGTGSGGTGINSVTMVKSKHASYDERDMFLMGGQGFIFRGFWPNNPVSQPTEPSNVYGVSMVKGGSMNSGGWVKLRSADPQDTPEICFNHFANGKEHDLEAMKDTVAWIRKIYTKVGITPLEPPCKAGIDANGYCGDEDEAWIRKQTFGHHPTSTNKIGADDDPMAVLDSKFRVRGADGLRVVDASAFARIPGVFPSISTFTISQKASDDMLSELEAGKAIKECSA